MTLEELYKSGTEMLKKADIENPSVDAFYLLEYAANLNRTRYLMYKDQQVNDRQIHQYTQLLQRRMTRIPYQYMTGTADFAGLTFEVNPSVLIPRLDTEILFELALRSLGPQAYVLDLCPGSGAIGISLKRYRPDIHMVISDISSEALEVAQRNVEHNRLEVARKQNCAADPKDLEYGYDLNFGVRIVQSDLFNQMAESEEEPAEAGKTAQTEKTAADTGTNERLSEKELVGQFDIIVSNPPYVTETEYRNLMPEVRDHEPKLALTAGEDGLDCYRRIAADAPRFLKNGGRMLLEIGCSQAAAVSELLKEQGFTQIQIHKDLAELDRVITCRKQP